MTLAIESVVITGASRGIGRGIATVLARDGFRVGVIARTAPLLEELAAELRADGGTVAVAPCDLADPDAVGRAVDALAAELGGVHALVNNAGVVTRKSALELSLEEWREMVDANIHGVFHATRAVLPRLVERGAGHIINISSISGRLPLMDGSGYAATKFAVTGFSQSLFLEVRDLGVKVTTVYPGSVDSASHRHDPAADHAWKVRPEEVGDVCRDVLRTAPNTLVSEVEIRPRSKSGAATRA